MLVIDSNLDHIPAGREHVIALFESINHPLVNIPNVGTAPTGAFVLGTRNDHGHLTVFVYLYQEDTRAVVVYVSEPRALAADQYRAEEADAVRFVESMGFLVDNLHFANRSVSEQDAMMVRVPIFRPPQSTVDLIDVAEDPESLSVGPNQGLSGALFEGLSEVDLEMLRRAGLSPSASPNDFGHRPYAPLGPSPGMGGSAATEIPPGFVAAEPPRNPSRSLPAVETPSGLSRARPSPLANPVTGSHPPVTAPRPHAVDRSVSTGRPPLAHVPGANPPVPTGRPHTVDRPASTGRSPLPDPGTLTGQPALGHQFEAEHPPAKWSPETGRRTALERLGRLLGTFGFLLGLTLGLEACVSDVRTFEERRALDSHIDLGHQQLARGMWPDAIRTFQAVLEKDSGQRDALRGMGLAYLNLGRVEEAEENLRAAVEADPDWSVPKNELAVVLIERKRCEEAEELLRKVLKDIFYETPQFAEHNLARAQACQGQSDEAIRLLENVVLKRPLFCLGYLTLAELSSEARRHELTIRACDDFAHHCEQNEKIRAQIAPEQSALCYLKKGLAYAELGDVESARASFSRCPPAGQHGRECRRSLSMLPP